MIVNDNGESFIVDRKQEVNNTYESITRTITDKDLESWKELDQIYRQEIAKEMEDYRKKNPSSWTEKKLPETSNQKFKIEK